MSDKDIKKLFNTSGFCLLYTSGTYDILNPDVHLLKEKAEKVGTNIEIKEYEGAEHILSLIHILKRLNKGAYSFLKFVAPWYSLSLIHS